jgi:serine/threonine protein phosphatase PrpC
MPEAESTAAPAPVAASVSAAGGRSQNEDRCGDGPTAAGHAWVVADGLGGHAAGELAAEWAVRALLDALAGRPALGAGELARAFDAAGAAIRAAQRERPDAVGCRTTAVVLAVEEGRAVWAHVGDSRLYHLRDGRVVHQTLDHSVPQALVQAGALEPEAIRRHPDRNLLLRCLGGDEPVEAAFAPEPVAVRPGDAFLLCTDGFWELVPEAAMEESLSAARDPADWLQRMEQALLGAARGAYDNYTATAVLLRAAADAEPASPRPPGWAARLRGRLGRPPRLRRGARLQSAAVPSRAPDGRGGTPTRVG